VRAGDEAETARADLRREHERAVRCVIEHLEVGSGAARIGFNPTSAARISAVSSASVTTP
jgi:hypothetical protein